MAMAKGNLKGLGDILALGKPPSSNPAMDAAGGDPASTDPDDENAFDDSVKPDEMMVGAAHDVMSALRAKDPEEFAAAMKSFVSMC